MPQHRSEPPHVVVIGGGFGGLCAARALGRAPVRVTLIDRRNHHLFQPLLYQVATGGLSPANIAAPLRALVRNQQNTRVLLQEVTGFDAHRRVVLLRDRLAEGQEPGSESSTELTYDYLIVATGAGQSYFGNDHWRRHAPGLKTLADATQIRRGVLMAFELAEQERDPEKIKQLLSFVVVGAGPTGVELAGALAEVARRTLAGEFRQVDPTHARVLLIEGADRVLPPFPPKLSAKAQAGLEKLGVEVRCNTLVSAIEDQTLELRPTDADPAEPGETLCAANILWAAGVQASPLGRLLAEVSNAETDRAGRIAVEADCSLAGRPEIFVIGDLASYRHGLERPLPGLAPVAMQQGRYVARLLKSRTSGNTSKPKPFHYVDKGNMAVIGRRMAVVDIHGLGFAGGFAWLTWLFVHLMYLAEFQNRVLVLVQWGWSYFTRNRSARLITEDVEDALERAGLESKS